MLSNRAIRPTQFLLTRAFSASPFQHAAAAAKARAPPPPRPSLPPNQWTVKVSDAAAKQLNYIKQRDQQPNTMLRILVQGGGCSGFEYKMDLVTEKGPNDREFEKDGATVVVDEESLEHMYGSTVDFTEGQLIKRSFVVVDNPHAEAGCGCGMSFDLKL